MSDDRPYYVTEVKTINVAELENDPHRLVGQYDLTFMNVTIEDTQVIQCNISNKHGYIFANAFITVDS